MSIDPLETARQMFGGKIIRVRVVLRREDYGTDDEWVTAIDQHGLAGNARSIEVAGESAWLEPADPEERRRWLDSLVGQNEGCLDGLSPVERIKVGYYFGPRFGKGSDPNEIMEI